MIPESGFPIELNEEKKKLPKDEVMLFITKIIGGTMRFIMFLFLIGLSHQSSQSYAQAKKPIVAVLDFQCAANLERKEASAITGRFRAILAETMAFDVLERDRMEDILKGQGFFMSDACHATDCLAQVGLLLGAQSMIAGEVGMIGGTHTP